MLAVAAKFSRENLKFNKEDNGFKLTSSCRKGFPFAYEHCIDFMVLTAVFNSISVMLRRPVQRCLLFWSSLTSTLSSQATGCFAHNHCQNNVQRRERNESCCIYFHQSMEKILAARGFRTSNLFSTHVPYRLSYGARLC